MIKCIIIEDEPLARMLLEQYIAKVSDFSLIAAFENPIGALTLLEHEAIDVIFCDIEMPELTGIDFLKTLNKAPVFIFTTAYSEFAIDAYTFGVCDYLLKPITFERFSICVERINKIIAPQPTSDSDFIFIKDGQKHIKIILNEILYIKSDDDYIHIVCLERKLIIYERLKNIITQLPNNQFIRTHNSYIVNINHVNSFQKDKVKIAGIDIPISEKYKDSVRQALKA